MSFDISSPEKDEPKVEPKPRANTKAKAKEVEPAKDLPKDATPLYDHKVDEFPSQGLSYPEGLEVTYKPFTFGEVKKASQSQMSIKTEFEFVLQGVTCSHGFDKNNLTLMDVYYLGFLRKIASFGTDKVTARYGCEECGQDGDHVFDNTELEFYDLDAKSLPIKAKLSSGEYKFSPLTISQYFYLFRKNKHLDELAKLAMECTNYKFEDAYKVFDDAEGFDAQVLEAVDAHLAHGLKPLKFRCQNEIFGEICNNEINLSVEGGHVLVRPFRGNKKSPESAISFG